MSYDPIGNQMGSQVDRLADNDDANAFIDRAFAINPIGVEYDPDECPCMSVSPAEQSARG
jgi:hypothetical protein